MQPSVCRGRNPSAFTTQSSLTTRANLIKGGRERNITHEYHLNNDLPCN